MRRRQSPSVVPFSWGTVVYLGVCPARPPPANNERRPSRSPPTSNGPNMNNRLENDGSGASLLLINSRLRDEYDECLHGVGEMADGKGGLWIDRAKRPTPLAKENRYLREMRDWEKAPTTEIGNLVADYVRPIDLATATDAEVERALRDLVAALCDAGHRVVCAEHLSSRRLYSLIVTGILKRQAKVLAKGQFVEWFCCFHTETQVLDLNDFQIYFRYYAEESEKEHWNKETPVPKRIAPPYRRPYLPRRRPIFAP